MPLDTPGVSFDQTPGRAMAAFRAKGLKATWDYRDMVQAEHARAFTVAKMTDLQMLAQVRASLDAHIARGATAQDWVRAIGPQMEKAGWWGKQVATDPQTGQTGEVQLGSPWRLRQIYRTNMAAAYAAGTWDLIQKTKATRPWLMYMAIHDDRTRPEHAAMDGTLLPVDDPWWSQHAPPNGYQCRCDVMQLNDRDLKAMNLAPKAPPKAPLKAWENPRTGISYLVPSDVAPTFAYNPGVAGLAALREWAKTTVAALPPTITEGWKDADVEEWLPIPVEDYADMGYPFPVSATPTPSQQLQMDAAVAAKQLHAQVDAWASTLPQAPHPRALADALQSYADALQAGTMPAPAGGMTPDQLALAAWDLAGHPVHPPDAPQVPLHPTTKAALDSWLATKQQNASLAWESQKPGSLVQYVQAAEYATAVETGAWPPPAAGTALQFTADAAKMAAQVAATGPVTAGPPIVPPPQTQALVDAVAAATATKALAATDAAQAITTLRDRWLDPTESTLTPDQAAWYTKTLDAYAQAVQSGTLATPQTLTDANLLLQAVRSSGQVIDPPALKTADLAGIGLTPDQRLRLADLYQGAYQKAAQQGHPAFLDDLHTMLATRHWVGRILRGDEPIPATLLDQGSSMALKSAAIQSWRDVIDPAAAAPAAAAPEPPKTPKHTTEQKLAKLQAEIVYWKVKSTDPKASAAAQMQAQQNAQLLATWEAAVQSGTAPAPSKTPEFHTGWLKHASAWDQTQKAAQVSAPPLPPPTPAPGGPPLPTGYQGTQKDLAILVADMAKAVKSQGGTFTHEQGQAVTDMAAALFANPSLGMDGPLPKSLQGWVATAEHFLDPDTPPGHIVIQDAASIHTPPAPAPAPDSSNFPAAIPAGKQGFMAEDAHAASLTLWAKATSPEDYAAAQQVMDMAAQLANGQAVWNGQIVAGIPAESWANMATYYAQLPYDVAGVKQGSPGDYLKWQTPPEAPFDPQAAAMVLHAATVQVASDAAMGKNNLDASDVLDLKMLKAAVQDGNTAWMGPLPSDHLALLHAAKLWDDAGKPPIWGNAAQAAWEQQHLAPAPSTPSAPAADAYSVQYLLGQAFDKAQKAKQVYGVNAVADLQKMGDWLSPSYSPHLPEWHGPIPQTIKEWLGVADGLKAAGHNLDDLQTGKTQLGAWSIQQSQDALAAVPVNPRTQVADAAQVYASAKAALVQAAADHAAGTGMLTADEVNLLGDVQSWFAQAAPTWTGPIPQTAADWVQVGQGVQAAGYNLQDLWMHSQQLPSWSWAESQAAMAKAAPGATEQALFKVLDDTYQMVTQLNTAVGGKAATGDYTVPQEVLGQPTLPDQAGVIALSTWSVQAVDQLQNDLLTGKVVWKGPDASTLDAQQMLDLAMDYFGRKVQSALTQTPKPLTAGTVLLTPVQLKAVKYLVKAGGKGEVGDKAAVQAAVPFVQAVLKGEVTFTNGDPLQGDLATIAQYWVHDLHAMPQAIDLNKPMWQKVLLGNQAPPPPPPLPVTPQTLHLPDAPLDTSGWKQVGQQAGSNEGGLYEDAQGTRWYVKWPKDPAHGKAEALTAALYRLADAGVPDVRLATDAQGRQGLASRWVDGIQTLGDAATAKKWAAKGQSSDVQRFFGLDAWLGNWDVAGLGFDNLGVDAAGKVYRIDVGGSLMYRAQGQLKPANTWTATVQELASLRDPGVNAQAATVFGKMTDSEVAHSVAEVLKLQRADIQQLVTAWGPGDAVFQDALTGLLLRRRADMLAQYKDAAQYITADQRQAILDEVKGSSLNSALVKQMLADDAAGLLTWSAHPTQPPVPTPPPAPAPAPSAPAATGGNSAWPDWAKTKHTADAAVSKPPKLKVPDVVKLADLTKVAASQQSNHLGVFTDAAGQKFSLKVYADEAQARNAVLGAELLKLGGQEVADTQLVRLNDGGGAVKWAVKSARPDDVVVATDKPDSMVQGVASSYGLDAWLANWGVTGTKFQNIGVKTTYGIKELVHLETGGMLLYNTTGLPKGAAFGQGVTELAKFLDGSNPQAAAMYNQGGVIATQAAVGRSVAQVLTLKDADLQKVVMTHGPGTPQDRQLLLDTLRLRRLDLLAQSPNALYSAKPKLTVNHLKDVIRAALGASTRVPVTEQRLKTLLGAAQTYLDKPTSAWNPTTPTGLKNAVVYAAQNLGINVLSQVKASPSYKATPAPKTSYSGVTPGSPKVPSATLASHYAAKFTYKGVDGPNYGTTGTPGITANADWDAHPVDGSGPSVATRPPDSRGQHPVNPEGLNAHALPISQARLQKGLDNWNARVQRSATIAGMAPADYTKAVVAQMQGYFDRAALAVRVPGQHVLKKILEIDGRFKTIHDPDVNSIGGSKGTVQSVERALFGLTDSNCDPRLRPIYGAFYSDVVAATKAGQSATLSHYGLTMVVLKDHVKQRTTHYHGDTFGYSGDRYAAGPATQVTEAALDPDATFLGKTDRELDKTGASYQEAHIHGGLRADAADIAEVLIRPGQGGGDRVDLGLLRALTQRGIPFRIFDNSGLDVTQTYVDLLAAHPGTGYSPEPINPALPQYGTGLTDTAKVAAKHKGKAP